MADTTQEAEWRAEFERFGEEQVRSTLDRGQFQEAKAQFARRWLGDEALARRVREKKILFWARVAGIFGTIAALIAAITAWPIFKGWLG